MGVAIKTKPYSMSPSPEMPLTDSERQNLRDMCVS